MIINPNTRDFWNKKIIRERDFLLKSPIYNEKNNMVVRYFYQAKGNLLNIGVGYGILEEHLNKYAPNLRFFGIDISDYAIARVKKNIKGKFVVTDARRLPFKSALFDHVLALDILEHFNINDSALVLNEVKRVLKKNGNFIVSVPLNEGKKNKSKNLHLVSFTEDGLLDLIGKAGFLIKRKEFLYAFKGSYLVKKLVNSLFKLRKPNLIVVFCVKK